MAEYKNYIGQKVADYEQLKDECNSFNHWVVLNPKQVVVNSVLCGKFFHDTITGSNYVASEYGIAKFTRDGIEWAINDEASLAKFIFVNKKVSQQYAIPSMSENEIKFKSKFA